METRKLETRNQKPETRKPGMGNRFWFQVSGFWFF